MATCTSCGNDVTGKKFCPECGTPVQPTGTPATPATESSATNTCARCNGIVKPGAAFCMHCGSSLSAHVLTATAASQPLTRQCIACHAEVPTGTAFCTNCGQSMQPLTVPPISATPTPASAFCTNCGRQNNPGVNFCAGCGSPLSADTATPAPQTAYPQSGPYPQPQYSTQYPQSPQQPQQYGQMGYQQEPMLGQQPMVLRCPVCMAMSPLGTANCPSCRTSLAGIVPTPANIPMQGQQGGFGGLGGFMQGDGGKYAMGALGGAAAVVGGEMLLHGLEHDRGYGYEHRREGEGMLGDLGDVANDVGLF